MSTTSTTFSFVLATTSDPVDVVTQIANNFSSIDSILSVAHTGTGQLKPVTVFVSPSLTNPTLVGTMTGGNVFATTGNFQTITATGGALKVNTLTVGTYSVPATVGNSGEVLTVLTGNAVWVANAPGTGANAGLSNLTSVVINTNLNTFTAGFITANRIIATSGALTGLTVFQATTGTFAGNVTITGTLTANVINATGGTITAGALSIGTYAMPATIGSTTQVLTVTTGNAVWLNAPTEPFSYEFIAASSFNTSANVAITRTVATNETYILEVQGKLTGSASNGIFVRFNTLTAGYFQAVQGKIFTAVDTGTAVAGYTTANAGIAISVTSGGVIGAIASNCAFSLQAKIFLLGTNMYIDGYSNFIGGSGNASAGNYTFMGVLNTATATSINIADANNDGNLSGWYRLYKLRTATT